MKFRLRKYNEETVRGFWDNEKVTVEKFRDEISPDIIEKVFRAETISPGGGVINFSGRREERGGVLSGPSQDTPGPARPSLAWW